MTQKSSHNAQQPQTQEEAERKGEVAEEEAQRLHYNPLTLRFTDPATRRAFRAEQMIAAAATSPHHLFIPPSRGDGRKGKSPSRSQRQEMMRGSGRGGLSPLSFSSFASLLFCLAEGLHHALKLALVLTIAVTNNGFYTEEFGGNVKSSTSPSGSGVNYTMISSSSSSARTAIIWLHGGTLFPPPPLSPLLSSRYNSTLTSSSSSASPSKSLVDFYCREEASFVWWQRQIQQGGEAAAGIANNGGSLLGSSNNSRDFYFETDDYIYYSYNNSRTDPLHHSSSDLSTRRATAAMQQSVLVGSLGLFTALFLIAAAAEAVTLVRFLQCCCCGIAGGGGGGSIIIIAGGADSGRETVADDGQKTKAAYDKRCGGHSRRNRRTPVPSAAAAAAAPLPEVGTMPSVNPTTTAVTTIGTAAVVEVPDCHDTDSTTSTSPNNQRNNNTKTCQYKNPANIREYSGSREEGRAVSPLQPQSSPSLIASDSQQQQQRISFPSPSSHSSSSSSIPHSPSLRPVFNPPFLCTAVTSRAIPSSRSSSATSGASIIFISSSCDSSSSLPSSSSCGSGMDGSGVQRAWKRTIKAAAAPAAGESSNSGDNETVEASQHQHLYCHHHHQRNERRNQRKREPSLTHPTHTHIHTHTQQHQQQLQEQQQQQQQKEKEKESTTTALVRWWVLAEAAAVLFLAAEIGSYLLDAAFEDPLGCVPHDAYYEAVSPPRIAAAFNPPSPLSSDINNNITANTRVATHRRGSVLESPFLADFTASITQVASASSSSSSAPSLALLAFVAGPTAARVFHCAVGVPYQLPNIFLFVVICRKPGIPVLILTAVAVVMVATLRVSGFVPLRDVGSTQTSASVYFNDTAPTTNSSSVSPPLWALLPSPYALPLLPPALVYGYVMMSVIIAGALTALRWFLDRSSRVSFVARQRAAARVEQLRFESKALRAFAGELVPRRPDGGASTVAALRGASTATLGLWLSASGATREVFSQASPRAGPPSPTETAGASTPAPTGPRSRREGRSRHVLIQAEQARRSAVFVRELVEGRDYGPRAAVLCVGLLRYAAFTHHLRPHDAAVATVAVFSRLHEVLCPAAFGHPPSADEPDATERLGDAYVAVFGLGSGDGGPQAALLKASRCLGAGLSLAGQWAQQRNEAGALLLPPLCFSLHCGPAVGEFPGLSPSTARYSLGGSGVEAGLALLQACAPPDHATLVSEAAINALGPAAVVDPNVRPMLVTIGAETVTSSSSSSTIRVFTKVEINLLFDLPTNLLSPPSSCVDVAAAADVDAAAGPLHLPVCSSFAAAEATGGQSTETMTAQGIASTTEEVQEEVPPSIRNLCEVLSPLPASSCLDDGQVHNLSHDSIPECLTLAAAGAPVLHISSANATTEQQREPTAIEATTESAVTTTTSPQEAGGGLVANNNTENEKKKENRKRQKGDIYHRAIVVADEKKLVHSNQSVDASGSSCSSSSPIVEVGPKYDTDEEEDEKEIFKKGKYKKSEGGKRSRRGMRHFLREPFLTSVSRVAATRDTSAADAVVAGITATRRLLAEVAAEQRIRLALVAASRHAPRTAPDGSSNSRRSAPSTGIATLAASVVNALQPLVFADPATEHEYTERHLRYEIMRAPTIAVNAIGAGTVVFVFLSALVEANAWRTLLRNAASIAATVATKHFLLAREMLFQQQCTANYYNIHSDSNNQSNLSFLPFFSTAIMRAGNEKNDIFQYYAHFHNYSTASIAASSGIDIIDRFVITMENSNGGSTSGGLTLGLNHLLGAILGLLQLLNALDALVCSIRWRPAPPLQIPESDLAAIRGVVNQKKKKTKKKNSAAPRQQKREREEDDAKRKEAGVPAEVEEDEKNDDHRYTAGTLSTPSPASVGDSLSCRSLWCSLRFDVLHSQSFRFLVGACTLPLMHPAIMSYSITIAFSFGMGIILLDRMPTVAVVPVLLLRTLLPAVALIAGLALHPLTHLTVPAVVFPLLAAVLNALARLELDRGQRTAFAAGRLAAAAAEALDQQVRMRDAVVARVAAPSQRRLMALMAVRAATPPGPPDEPLLPPVDDAAATAASALAPDRRVLRLVAGGQPVAVVDLEGVVVVRVRVEPGPVMFDRPISAEEVAVNEVGRFCAAALLVARVDALLLHFPLLGVVEAHGCEVVLGGPWGNGAGGDGAEPRGSATAAHAVAALQFLVELRRAVAEDGGGARVTAVATVDDVVVLMRNPLYPVFDVCGPGALRTRELLRAAPPGTVVCTDGFRRVASLALPAAAARLMPPSGPWVVRGLPVTRMYAVTDI